jgi:acyl-CoA reductase-like NAD-dependent aldehyde dehydrogenase
MEKYQFCTGGKFVDAETGEARATINPATEEPIALVPVATRDDTRAQTRRCRSFPFGRRGDGGRRARDE